MKLFWTCVLFLYGTIAVAAVPQTAAWDLHPQAAELTAIELQWWTSSDPTIVDQSVDPTETTATTNVNGSLGDTVFVKARACANQNCSPWTADVSSSIAPMPVTNLRFQFSGTLMIIPD